MPLPMQALLNQAGLNRLHVFNVAALPQDVLQPLAPSAQETQLILFGHAGRRLWERVQAQRGDEAHPIDDYSVRTVRQWLAQAVPQAQARFVYPVGMPPGKHVGLQRLGQLAGWHHASPFMVGVDAQWGSWFAYRAAILTDTHLPVSETMDSGDPCANCTDKPCIQGCLGQALTQGTMDFQACLSQRLQPDSACALACNARLSCPVGIEHRYETSQIEHAARLSLAAIRRYAQTPR